MNPKSPHTPTPRGTTLIEVLAGLVILSTLLVSLAIARGRFITQWTKAEQHIIATKQIDALLEQWLVSSPQSVPIQSRGQIDNSSHHVWQTRIMPNSAATSFGTIVVRLQVYDRSIDDHALSQVDFLLKDPKAPGGAK